MDLFTFERKGNCNSTHGMCIDNKVFINSKYLENKKRFSITNKKESESQQIIYLLLSEEAANFIARSVALAFALEIKMVEYNNHDKILYYRKKDSPN